ncbi:protein S40-3-like [Bidens hawaiensis]|uniref:protein S40-3-like n=1 Tax=Bidens hawaiensis TaxID=980011 RepID=UPI00404A9695
MPEEFEESEVVFNVNNVVDEDYCLNYFPDSDADESQRTKRKKVEKKTKAKSVTIPVNLTWCRYVDPSLYDYEEESGEMVPPHVMVRRRLAGKMTFSVCSGIGRTLKGRDLSEMRNSVLRMTGFLET